MVSIVLIGCGNMGRAMLEGWLTTKRVMPGEVVVIEPVVELRDAARTLGVASYSELDAINGQVEPDYIVIAVKPQSVLEILPTIARFKSCSTYVSLVAGVPIAALQKKLGNDAAIVRCMPNIPAAIGEGMIATFAGAQVVPLAMNRLHEILTANGAVTEIEKEELMDAVTAVSGSGPAYVFHFIECLEKAGINLGLPSQTARLLAIQTVYGAAMLAEKNTDDPGTLGRKVTSFKGTTAAAMDVLASGGALQRLITQAVDAAHKRSVELSIQRP